MHKGMLLVTVSCLALAVACLFRVSFAISLESACAGAWKPTPGTNRTKIVVPVGLEGSGHHNVEEVLTWRLGMRTSVCPAGVVEEHLHFDKRFMWFINQSAALGYMYFSQVSFPEKRDPQGRISEALHPSLIHMVCLNKTEAIDLRLIYLRRDPVDALCSAIRRFDIMIQNDYETEMYVKTAVDSLLYINSVLRHSEVTFEIVDFADSLANLRHMTKALNYGLRGIVSVEDIKRVLGRPVRAPPHAKRNENFTCPHRNYIEDTIKETSAFLDGWMLPRRVQAVHKHDAGQN